eukprot:gene1480-biopygen263
MCPYLLSRVPTRTFVVRKPPMQCYAVRTVKRAIHACLYGAHARHPTSVQAAGRRCKGGVRPDLLACTACRGWGGQWTRGAGERDYEGPVASRFGLANSCLSASYCSHAFHVACASVSCVHMKGTCKVLMSRHVLVHEEMPRQDYSIIWNPETAQCISECPFPERRYRRGSAVYPGSRESRVAQSCVSSRIATFRCVSFRPNQCIGRASGVGIAAYRSSLRWGKYGDSFQSLRRARTGGPAVWCEPPNCTPTGPRRGPRGALAGPRRGLGGPRRGPGGEDAEKRQRTRRAVSACIVQLGSSQALCDASGTHLLSLLRVGRTERISEDGVT